MFHRQSFPRDTFVPFVDILLFKTSMYVTNIVIIPFQSKHNTNQLKPNQLKSKQNVVFEEME